MKALSRDRNWLKIIGIFVVLTMTLLLSRCSENFIEPPQTNAKQAMQKLCQEQTWAYERTGQLVEDVKQRGWLINAYPEFYTNFIRRSENQIFYYATSKSQHLKSYVGMFVGLPGGQPRKAISIVCESEEPGVTPATDPIFDNLTLTCGVQTLQIKNVET
ncbi:type IV pilin-like G/H family protein [Anabaena sp. WFMT]|uniref:type IV pilin-like G/H family protein n=1 Tax=Anabaena sp. WFMT TaxID=3449730 RepID=UPI003F213148